MNTEILHILHDIKLRQAVCYKYLGISFNPTCFGKLTLSVFVPSVLMDVILLKAPECFRYPILRILYFLFIQGPPSYCIE